MKKRFIPVSSPVFLGNEKKYVRDCLNTTWISSNGKYIEEFEREFARFCGAKHAISCCNGTVALHLALRALGVTAGDEVLIPTLTFVATANAVTYCGAKPVLVDSEARTWNMDPAQVEKKITSRTKGIIPVHLYGHPVEMDSILSIARRHKLFILEDAAEAHGAEYKGQRVGPIGDIGIFSFYGNKIITCGEGGMVVTNDSSLATIVRQTKGQGMDFHRRYWFPMIGYNYRMTNIAAAIGLGQLEKIDLHLSKRLEIASYYQEQFKNYPELILQQEEEWAKHSFWIFTIVLPADSKLSRDEVMSKLAEKGIETRPVFYPMHILPPYLEQNPEYPVADRIGSQGISLPTWGGLSKKDIVFISRSLIECIQ